MAITVGVVSGYLTDGSIPNRSWRGWKSRVERAMGIDNTALELRILLNQRVAGPRSTACDYGVTNGAIVANASQCGRRLSQATNFQSKLPTIANLIAFVTCFQLMSNGENQNDIVAW